MNQSLSTFELDVGFCSDPRIRQLIASQGGLSAMVYVLLLSRVYSSEGGYYLIITDEVVTDIAVTLRCKSMFVHEALAACYRTGLFTTIPDAPYVITSPSIQRRYLDLCARTGRSVTLTDYRLIAEATPQEQQHWPPTIDDVRTYITQHQWDTLVNADEFCRYYSETGWKIHGEPISDWRRKVDKWADRRLNPQQVRKGKPKASGQPPPYRPPVTMPNVDAKASADEFRKKMGISGSITDFIMSQKK